MTTTPDRQLVERFLASRDEAAFCALYRAHTPYLWRLALRLCQGGEAEAEEAVQETWVRSVRLLPRFAWGSALRTWLAGILINALRESRKVRRRFVDGVEPPCAPAGGPPAPAEGLALDLERALSGMTDELRTVLLLFDLEGYSHEEIGSILGIPPGTSKSRLFTARRLLRARLGGSLGDTHATT